MRRLRQQIVGVKASSVTWRSLPGEPIVVSQHVRLFFILRLPGIPEQALQGAAEIL
jgi:hypothetical protein